MVLYFRENAATTFLLDFFSPTLETAHFDFSTTYVLGQVLKCQTIKLDHSVALSSLHRALVSKSAKGAWHPRNFWRVMSGTPLILAILLHNVVFHP